MEISIPNTEEIKITPTTNFKTSIIIPISFTNNKRRKETSRYNLRINGISNTKSHCSNSNNNKECMEMILYNNNKDSKEYSSNRNKENIKLILHLINKCRSMNPMKYFNSQNMKIFKEN